MSRRTSLSLALLACLVALPVAETLAQDRAAVGGGSDSAFVGGDSAMVGGGSYNGQAMSAPGRAVPTLPDTGGASLTGGFGGDMGSGSSPERASQEVQALLNLVQGQMDGSRTTGNAATDGAAAARYRGDADELVRRYWNQLSPVTRDMYTANYGRSHPDASSERYRSPYGDNGQIENELLGGTRDAAQSMQHLEDLLLPMLRDLKQGVDTNLRNRGR
jgi:hypothetical protein